MLHSSISGQQGELAQAIIFTKHDIMYFFDFFALIATISVIRHDQNYAVRWPRVLKFIAVGFALLIFNFTISFFHDSEAYGKSFNREYVVRNNGLFPFLAVGGYNARQLNEKRRNASAQDIKTVEQFVKNNQTDLNMSYYGKANGKNLIVIHLESLQMSSIDLKVNGQEVTPFLNSLFHSNSSLSFDNFYNEVGQGRTSDAENLIDTSTFGLSQGSLFNQLGSSQVFQALPGILQQQAGYSSAVFHANNPLFYNRSNVYKNMGYQNFISSDYFDNSKKNLATYGLKDKLLFKESVPYLERL